MAEFLSSLDQIKMLRRSMGNQATGDVPDDALSQFIWMAECELASMYEFSELRDYEDVATIADKIDYELDEADVLRFLSPANNLTTSVEMEMMDEDWDRKVGSRLTGAGSAFWYYESGVGDSDRKQVRIRPTPSGIETVRVPFIKIPTMLDTEEAMRSDLPASHTRQVLAHAAEIGLEMIGDRDEADKQTKRSGISDYAARHDLPPASFYRNRLQTFQQRMNIPRGNRGRRRRG